MLHIADTAPLPPLSRGKYIASEKPIIQPVFIEYLQHTAASARVTTATLETCLPGASILGGEGNKTQHSPHTGTIGWRQINAGGCDSLM